MSLARNLANVEIEVPQASLGKSERKGNFERLRRK